MDACRRFLLFLSLVVLCSGTRRSFGKDTGEPEQIHISLAGISYIKVTWITSSSDTPSTVSYGTASGSYPFFAQGQSKSYSYVLYKSGHIHDVKIGPLQPNTTYFYKVGGTSSELSFKTPPALGPEVPISFAVLGDLGQTSWSASTLDHVKVSDHDVLLFAGDLSYADSSQPLWDSFGRLVQSAASSRPWMVTEGNHEIERLLFIEPFRAYNARWSMPYQESESDSNLYYSFEVGGVHVLMLGSYTDYGKDSNQYRWLQGDLKKVDRNKTPWLIALVHAPWYSSNLAHLGDGDAMMQSMEPLLHEAKVDMIFAGHIHAYERTSRLFLHNYDACGAIHITVGDGGNREGLARRFKNPQPDWSLYREASFGHGLLKFLNSTHASWTWHRNDDKEAVARDSLYITSLTDPSSRCDVTARSMMLKNGRDETKREL